MSPFPLTGRCNCGAVQFEVSEPLVLASYCHCTRCQRRSGAAASANAHPAPGSFRVVAGEDKLRVWKPQDGREKWFFGDCGSALSPATPTKPTRSASGWARSTVILESGRACGCSWPTRPPGSQFPTTDSRDTAKAPQASVTSQLSQRPGSGDTLGCSGDAAHRDAPDLGFSRTGGRPREPPWSGMAIYLRRVFHPDRQPL